MEYKGSGKYRTISQLAEEGARAVTVSREEWMRYLTTASRLYKYPFEDQLLIYLQRPDATACASFDIWNEKMFCRVNRGAKGIALLDRENETPVLRYVFDVSDVHKAGERSREPYIWKLREEHKGVVLAQLERSYGATDSSKCFEERLIELSKNVTRSHSEEVLLDVRYVMGDGGLGVVDDVRAAEMSKVTIASSVAFFLLARCGADMSVWSRELNFAAIGRFNTPRALALVGNMVSETCKPILMEIARTVMSYDRERAALSTRGRAERGYIGRGAERSVSKTEGRDGADLRNQGRASRSEADPGQGPEGAAYDVRSDAQKISDGAQKGGLQRDAAVGDIEGALPYGAEAGRAEDGLSDSKDGEAAGSGRESQGIRPGVMGGAYEQHPTIGPGERAEGADIQPVGSRNFRISDDNLGVGGPKEKFRRNIEAVKTLFAIEGANRGATPEEQEILSRYVGWGGLPQAFDEKLSAWAGEYEELKGLLPEAEYVSARASTLNAHYTSPVVIRAMYEALDRMGFERGNILEPSCGVGNFFGLLPEKMYGSRLYGVELDSISGRIAGLLYPDADITVGGFETTDRRDFYDVAIGNVPFGQYKVADRAYDRLGFSIHDYFFAKTLDQVRAGGVIAFVTSRYTMDKKTSEVRKYIAERAELLGAIRLPENAFRANAGTEVVADILFLQKRDRLAVKLPSWVELGRTPEGHAVNSYFTEHPEMVLGSFVVKSTQYGREDLTVRPFEDRSLEEQLREAVTHIHGKIRAQEVTVGMEGDAGDKPGNGIPADPGVRNYSYSVMENKVYYREGTLMRPVEAPDTTLRRIKGMVGLRDCTRELIRVQLEDYGDDVINERQAQLNGLYDAFSKKYGSINSTANRRAFAQDSSYCLLCSLEKLDEEGRFAGKADIFTKRTIKRAEAVKSVETAEEALAVSLSERGEVDLEYMSKLSGRSPRELAEGLSGVIFREPVSKTWQTADEYLSGNVREKLETAREYARTQPEYAVNEEALARVQPRELEASEIEVRLGATWIGRDYIEDFMRDVLKTPRRLVDRGVMGVMFSDVTGEWRLKGKNLDQGNSLVTTTYGTGRRNAYQILEDSLNLRDSRVYEIVEIDGVQKSVLDKKETAIAVQKQEALGEAFKDWIFKDRERRQELVAKYNRLFNSTRPREYDGRHLFFPGMNREIALKDYQKNAVAHVLYGNNTLLAHCVGAGKTFEMAAAAMELKRLGLCHKSMFVVPNHLIEQWAGDFMRLYPGANVLAATRRDFEPANRKKFCSRIATGEYDAVIIGHSQFERIPLSLERQAAWVQEQIDEVTQSISEAKEERGESYTIKQMEKSRKSLQEKLKKLNNASMKDDVVTFEELGVDRLFIDESQNYKNLYLYTKMRNVAGVAQVEAQKSTDLFAKCRYLDEITGGRGVTFATGTPISNSMTELYTNMRYLQYGTLKRMGLSHFDSWASAFGETQTAIELAPEGTGYRAKTRFARFFNLPELMNLFKESADIQTPDMLELPVPAAEYVDVVLKPSSYQKEMVQALAERAEDVRNRLVEPNVDNMLKITGDGRKLALDQRLINDALPDDPGSKTAACADRAFEVWERTREQRSTQLIFCDSSTPKGDGTFNVYEDLRKKLVERGVPPEEIAFIHDANTELRKAELFGKVRSGQVRFLFGSTQKMGAGTNVQDRLIALHHLDVPWRPSDIEQQEGRILRQGNLNPKVQIFRYVTEGTFDAYSWQIIENKQKFISQIMTSKSPVRSCEDVDEAALSYAEVKALATGNPYIKEKMDLDIQVSKLKLMKAEHARQRYRLEDDIAQQYPRKIAALKERVAGLEADIETAKINLAEDKREAGSAGVSGDKEVAEKKEAGSAVVVGDKEVAEKKEAGSAGVSGDKEVAEKKEAGTAIVVGDRVFTDRKEAGAAILEKCRQLPTGSGPVKIGEYAGFSMVASFAAAKGRHVMELKGRGSHMVELGADPLGNMTRINNAIEAMPKELSEARALLDETMTQLENAKIEVEKPFAKEAELLEKTERLALVNARLNLDEVGESGVGTRRGQGREVGECEDYGRGGDVCEVGERGVQREGRGCEVDGRRAAEREAEVRGDYERGGNGPRGEERGVGEREAKGSIREKLAHYRGVVEECDREKKAMMAKKEMEL